MNKKEYLDILENTNFQQTYAQIIKFLYAIRNNLNKQFYDVGPISYGPLDFTYFSLTSPILKEDKLRIGIVFNHSKFSIEWWLLGQNKQVTQYYQSRFSTLNQHQYAIKVYDLLEVELSQDDLDLVVEKSLAYLHQAEGDL